jgi:integrase
MQDSRCAAGLLLSGLPGCGEIRAQGQIFAEKREAGRQAIEGRGEEPMSVYRRGEVWWYKFRFNGQVIRESADSGSKTVARDAERVRRRELEEGLNGIRRQRARLFSVASQEWLDLKRSVLSPRSVQIEQANLKHLTPHFGGKLIGDIEAADISRYQQKRIGEGAAAKTVNLEVGTVRAILRKNRLWANVQPDVNMLSAREDVGRAISQDEESRLLAECGASRSRSLFPAVTVALATGMRYSEIRLLRWKQVDLEKRSLTVGDSKTEAGAGRPIPLNDRAYHVLDMWASHFPNREPEHYVFPTEKCGAAGDDFKACVYATDSTTPIGDWKEAWEKAKERAKVSCRFHDLRHTACTRMLENGAPFSVVATIMGWSPSTAVRMSRRYGHIGQAAQREAVKSLNGAVSGADGAQNWAQFQTARVSARAN